MAKAASKDPPPCLPPHPFIPYLVGGAESEAEGGEGADPSRKYPQARGGLKELVTKLENDGTY